MTRLHDGWGRVRNSYLPIPTVMLVLAIGGAIGMVWVDELLLRAGVRVVWLTTLKADAARSILATLAGSMATIASVVFSITIVALQLAASQFGPHVMRAFLADRGSQFAFGTFVAIFAYALVVLVTGRADSGFVPYAATYLGIVLGIAAMGVLVYFISHVANSIRLESVIDALADSLAEATETVFPERLGSAEPVEPKPASATPGWFHDRDVVVEARASGYIRRIDSRALMRLAASHDLLIRLEALPGDFVVPGMALMTVAPRTRLEASTPGRLRGVVALGERRTPEQDIPYAFQQLTEVAVRALSPGINAPFTAIPAIDAIAAGLVRVTERRMPASRRLDRSGTERILLARFHTLAELAHDALGPIASAATRQAFVGARVVEVAFLLASRARLARDRDELLAFAEAIAEDAIAALGSERERMIIRARRDAAAP
ncbi:MAG: DUF2254 domain-containing protein [Acetobacteraceae bacterium]